MYSAVALKSPQGEVIETCTILTTEANAAVAAIHDRMPVIILEADYERWFAGDAGDLLQPIAPNLLTLRPISTHVNNPRNDDEACLKGVG